MNVLLLVKNGDFIRAKEAGGDSVHLLRRKSVYTGRNTTISRPQGSRAAESLKELMTTGGIKSAWIQPDPPLSPHMRIMDKCLLKSDSCFMVV